MSQDQYQAVVDRASWDATFRRLLQTDPSTALASYNLTPIEVDTLTQMYSGDVRGAI